ncbi:MAG: hypothetical protein NT001_07045 [Candidatus Woesearchaeota archaeon]|nr:hypothetical protein [Candidatus Woesearchaeota archaeon]
MHNNIKEMIARILEIIAEIESYEFYKNNLLYSSDVLFKEYQEGMYTYDEYNLLLQSLLKGKSKKEWVKYYDSYTYSLLKRIEPLLSQIIYMIYHDKSTDWINAQKGIRDMREISTPKPSDVFEVSEPYSSKADKSREESRKLEEYEFVEVKRPSIVSKLKEAVIPKEKVEDKYAGDYSDVKKKEEHAMISKSEKGMPAESVSHISFEKKAAFFDALKDAVIHKKEEDLKVNLRPDEDKALRKLITHVDEINKEAPRLIIRGPSSVLGIRVKLLLLRLHFIKRLLAAKKRVPYSKEEREEEKAIGYYAFQEVFFIERYDLICERKGIERIQVIKEIILCR